MTTPNDILTPRQQYERDVRLYGLTVARWLEQKRKENWGLSVNGRRHAEPGDDHRACGTNASTVSVGLATAADKPLTSVKNYDRYI